MKRTVRQKAMIIIPLLIFLFLAVSILFVKISFDKTIDAFITSVENKDLLKLKSLFLEPDRIYESDNMIIYRTPYPDNSDIVIFRKHEIHALNRIQGNDIDGIN